MAAPPGPPHGGDAPPPPSAVGPPPGLLPPPGLAGMPRSNPGSAIGSAAAPGDTNGASASGPRAAPKYEIRDVWADNLDAEMRLVRQLASRYAYVAMDTEFPGVVARPIGQFQSTTDYHYQTLRCNVDLLKVIQVGITFADADGNVPPDACTFQFNFKFSLQEDMFAHESIELLAKAGLDFAKHEQRGIDLHRFGELLITSGLVLMPDVSWISFHSGYDFGYLLKLLTCRALPPTERDFFKQLSLYFPAVYDIKHVLMRACGPHLKGGLQDAADELGVDRVGTSHQAGSDSLLTARTFFALRRRVLEPNGVDERQFAGFLHGLGNGRPVLPGHGRQSAPLQPILSDA